MDRTAVECWHCHILCGRESGRWRWLGKRRSDLHVDRCERVWDPDAYANSDAYAYAYANTNSNADSNSESDSNANANTYTDSNSESERHADAEPDPDAGRGGDHRTGIDDRRDGLTGSSGRGDGCFRRPLGGEHLVVRVLHVL
jgi:hypothetical protein